MGVVQIGMGPTAQAVHVRYWAWGRRQGVLAVQWWPCVRGCVAKDHWGMLMWQT